MKLTVETQSTVLLKSMNGFTSILKLSPSFPKLKLNRFDGCKVGDEVHLN
jgi:hypothetical protein